MATEVSKDNKLTAAAIVGVIVLVLVGGWINSTQKTGESVISLMPQIATMQETLAGVVQWQQDWPTKGELSADIRQNEKLRNLETEMRILREAKLETGERLTRVEERQTAIQSDLKKIISKLDVVLSRSEGCE